MIGDILSQALNKSLFGVEDTTTGLLGSTLTRAIPTLAGSRGSSSKSMWTSLGTGLLAGLLGGMGERQANRQNADLYAQAQNLYSASPDERASIVSQNPRLTDYATALGATELQQQQAIKQKQLEAQILRENEKYKANLALPKEAIGALGTAGASPATILQAVEKARAGESLTSALLGGQVVNPSAEITDAQVEIGARTELPSVEFSPFDDKATRDLKSENAKLKLRQGYNIEKEKRDQELAIEKEKRNNAFKFAEKFSEQKSFIEESASIANELNQIDSWTDFRKMRSFSSADKNGLALRLKNLADKLARARSGAALNDAEKKHYDQLISGDLTASPQDASRLLRKLATTEAKYVQDQIKLGQTVQDGGMDSLIEGFNLPEANTSQGGNISTETSSQIIENNGVKYIVDPKTKTLRRVG